MKRICHLAVVAVILALAAGPATSGDRVNEICAVAGDIEYCVPQNT
jgi:hypothetical protein